MNGQIVNRDKDNWVYFPCFTSGGKLESNASITCTISHDGGTAVACSNGVETLGDGLYRINLTREECNAQYVSHLRVLADGTDQDSMIAIFPS